MRIRLPLFVLFEGIDGSGKTTLADTVARHFSAAGVPVARLGEPTDGVWGRRIRALLRGNAMPPPEEQMALFLEDRADDVARNIRPALADGRLVVMDRYYFSNAAYQGAAGLSPAHVIEENRARNFPEPDRVYLADVAPEEALRRIEARNAGTGATELFERREFLASVRATYRALTDERFVILDAALPPDALAALVIDDMHARFGM
ncbi:MAG TPA: dTMP kinase [Spirochaetota bacterium]|nr:dTMP kinase [Spirochaetota bacterium]HOS40336.1 dTMP kinase [Spirochaetota bacterium]HPI21853.1 dTMP kinase [Spirochaetota bacterium]HPU86952.1 dTMP kinase [Spirochaetota bacterium]